MCPLLKTVTKNGVLNFVPRTTDDLQVTVYLIFVSNFTSYTQLLYTEQTFPPFSGFPPLGRAPAPPAGDGYFLPATPPAAGLASLRRTCFCCCTDEGAPGLRGAGLTSSLFGLMTLAGRL